MGIGQRKARLLPLIIPLLLFLAFFSLSTRTARRAPWYEQALWNLIAPPQALATMIGHGVSSVWNGYFDLVGAKAENAVLKTKVLKLEGDMIKMGEVEGENERLKGLLAYRDSFPQKFVMATVVANDPRAEFKSITIDKGSDDGIGPLMPVVGPKGLVGRVGVAAGGYSRVLLITDPNSAVDVFVQRSRARGIVTGAAIKSELRPASYMSRLEFLRRISDVKDGDILVTSGLDRVFPSGIPVGTVHDIAKTQYGIFLSADVAPFEDLPELTEVGVMLVQMDFALPQELRE
jgi:rod shape-determining protein MreC